MAGRRKKIKEKAFSIANTLFPALKVVTPIVAFISQLTQKDRQTLGASFSDASKGTQAKILINIIGGRMFGVTIFKKLSDGTVLPTAPQTINFDNIINDWTKLGAYGIIYKMVGGVINKVTTKYGLGSNIPHTAKIGSLAKGVLGGGLLGSIFDAPANGSSPNTGTTSFPSLQNTPQLQVVSSRTSYHHTTGHSESAF